MNPLLIPEIISLVGAYLQPWTPHLNAPSPRFDFTPKDLLSCCQVSKAWRKNLLPILWYTYDKTAMTKVPLDLLSRNSVYFRIYRAAGTHEGSFPECRFLKDLELHWCTSSVLASARNPNLKRLVWFGSSPTKGLEAMSLEGVNQLQELGLHNFGLRSGSSLVRLLCPSASSLTSLTLVSFKGEFVLSKEIDLLMPRLKELTLEMGPGQLQELMRCVPNLESLTVTFQSKEYCLLRLASRLHTHCPNLSTLRVKSPTDRFKSLIALLFACKRTLQDSPTVAGTSNVQQHSPVPTTSNRDGLVHLELNLEFLNTGIIQAIQLHRNTLQSLDLMVQLEIISVNSAPATSFTDADGNLWTDRPRNNFDRFQTLLQTCDQLREVSFWDVFGVKSEAQVLRILRSSPWICTLLEEISIRGYQPSPTEISSPSAISPEAFSASSFLLHTGENTNHSGTTAITAENDSDTTRDQLREESKLGYGWILPPQRELFREMKARAHDRIKLKELFRHVEALSELKVMTLDEVRYVRE